MLRSMYRKMRLLCMVIDCGNALRWSRVSHKLRAIFSFHYMMPATPTFTEKQQLGAVLTIHKLKLCLASFRPRNTSTRVYSHFHSHIISSDLVDNNAVSFNSQLNGLLTTLGTVYPSLSGLRLSAHLAGITQSGTM